MRYEPYMTYVAVAKAYHDAVGDTGVEQLMADTFTQSVSANGGFAAKLTRVRALSRREARDIGLQPHAEHDVTWYRLEGSAIKTIVGVH